MAKITLLAMQLFEGINLVASEKRGLVKVNTLSYYFLHIGTFFRLKMIKVLIVGE